MTRKLSTKEILKNNLDRKSPLRNERIVLWVHNIRSMHNIGSIFRSADAFGVEHILLSGYSPTPPRAEITKTAIGAEDYVDWTYYDDAESAIEWLKSNDFELLGLEQTDNSLPLPEFKLSTTTKYCLVLGNEVSGIDDSILPHLKHCVEIPQFGQKHSLNVSVAAGVLLYSVLQKLWSDYE